MKTIDQIFTRMASTTYFDESNFLREQTTQPQVIEQCLAQLSQLHYESVTDFYAITANVAYAYHLLNEPAKAIQYYEKAMQVLIDGDAPLCGTYIRLADVQMYDGQYEAAKCSLLRAQRLLQQYGHQEYEQVLFEQLAKLYWLQHSFEDAHAFVEKVLLLQHRTQSLLTQTILRHTASLRYA